MEQQISRPKSPSTKTDKLDVTTEAAYQIIDQQALDREKKTRKLRALRFERDAQQKGQPAKTVRSKRTATA